MTAFDEGVNARISCESQASNPYLRVMMDGREMMIAKDWNDGWLTVIS